MQINANVQLPPAKHVKYSTDDGNISPQSISGAPVSTTLYPSSYHDQFPPGPEDVLQGSPTLNASPSPRMPPAAIDDIPHASFSNENNAPSNVVNEARSNQVAFLRRMFDDSNGGKPIVEVISTYMAPDRSELNYHAGIGVQSHGVIEVTVKHCGFQFIESEEDILLAGLVFHACYQPESDLSKNSMFLTMFGLSEAEQALKSGLSTMLTGDIHKGKTTILDFIHSKLT
eukprot:Em0012g1072a